MEKAKKTIRIAITNFWKDFVFEDTPTYAILNKHFNIIISKDNPDFVISSVFGNIVDSLMYNCPRIQYIGEPLTPDFVLYDYAIGFDNLKIMDQNMQNRFFRLPNGFSEWHNRLSKEISSPISDNEAESIYRSKTKFCNFIYGHESANHIREDLLKTVEKYKHVDSAGRFLNNMPDGRIVGYSSDKLNFMRDYKFSIACESMIYPGFLTEKILHAFYANSIPIYLGDPFVGEVYNEKAFINVKSFDNASDLLSFIHKVDNDKALFINMIKENKYVVHNYYEQLMKDYETFLLYIFNQNPNDAFRRQKYYMALEREKSLIYRFSDKKNGLFKFLKKV